MFSMASLRVAIFRQIAQHEIVALLSDQHLRQRVAADGRLNGVLHVGDIDSEARGLIAIHFEIQIRLAEHAEQSQILDAGNRPHHADDLIAFVFERFEIVAVNFHGERAFHAADGFFQIV